MPKDDLYDTTEALAILADACERIAPDTAAATKASRALFDEIAKLGARLPAGLAIKAEAIKGIAFHAQRPQGQQPVTLHLQNPHGSPDLHIVDYPSGAYVKVTGLRFNSTAERLEGLDDDTSIEPTPGRPRPKRGAMAVVVEQVLTKLDAKRAAEAEDVDWNIRTS